MVTKVVRDAAGQWTTVDGQAVIVEIRVVRTVEVVRGVGGSVALGIPGWFVITGRVPGTRGEPPFE